VQLRSKSRRYTNASLEGVRGDGCVWILESVFHRIIDKQVKYGFRTACKKLEEHHYIKRYFGDRYVKKESFGVVSADFYCILLPNNDTVINKIEKMKEYDRSLVNVNKTFGEDYYGEEDYSSLKNFCKEDEDKMLLGFLCLSAQNTRMIVNDKLKNALGLRASDRLYFLPMPKKGVLIFGNERLVKDAPSCALSISGDNKSLFTDARKIDKLLRLFDEKIEIYHRLLLTDIHIESKGDIKVAIINMKNRFGRWSGALCKTDPLSIDDIFFEEKHRGSKIHELLSDEEET
jgi:hypothetical protein